MKIIIKISLRIFLGLSFLISGEIQSQTVAFPGAEGNGKFTSGGRGGRVIEVINLNDKGSGSFRDALQQDGARTIIFKISGTINLESDLIISQGDLTVAGQTAPGDGICIKNFQTTINADNIIIRYLRFRLGDERKQAADALSVMNCKNVIVDHCSFSWGTDEVFSFYDNENSTMQWCIISEALHNSFHPKGEHGYGGIWGGKNASFHHNLLAHNASRNPRFNGSRTKYSPQEELVDFRNNVIYNWGFNSSYGGESASINITGNYYKSGPATKQNVKSRIIDPWDADGKWYVSNNYVYSFPDITKDNWNGGVQGDYSEDNNIISSEPFKTEHIETDSPEAAFNKILKSAGAVFPKRDVVDKRIIGEVLNGTSHAGNGIIDSQEQVGGWPLLKSVDPPADSDHDGMPDYWELKQNLNPSDSEDRNKISASGYTFLEDYLNELCDISLSDCVKIN